MATRLTFINPDGVLIYSAAHRTERAALEVLAWLMVKTPGCKIQMEPCELPVGMDETMEQYIASGKTLD
jgi:hypothetical protein